MWVSSLRLLRLGLAAAKNGGCPWALASLFSLAVLILRRDWDKDTELDAMLTLLHHTPLCQPTIECEPIFIRLAVATPALGLDRQNHHAGRAHPLKLPGCLCCELLPLRCCSHHNPSIV